jgi:1-acyl-sn-glycerol-3-phosphate acyltransferase
MMGPRFAPGGGAHPVDSETAMERARGDRYWLRLPATGLCFVVFGIAALLLGMLVLPLVRLLARSPERARWRARAVIAASMRAFIYFMRVTGVLSYSFAGRASLGRQGQLIIANHPTLIDVLFLIGFVPQASCIVKSGLFANVFTRAAVKAADYIPNSPTDEMLQRAGRSLLDGQTLIIFPEGTRTVPGQSLQLQRGAANIALRGASALTPVYIDCEPPTLSKNQPWYRIPARRARFTLRVGDDIALDAYRPTPLPRGSRQLNAHLAALFAEAGSSPAMKS